MITVEMKDLILKDLVTRQGKFFPIHPKEESQKHNTDRYTYEIILEHFEKKGFLDGERCSDGQINIYLKTPAFDFYAHGGFYAHEELLEKTFEKLLLEIEALKKSKPEKFAEITAIMANIATAMGFIFNR